LVSLLFFAHLQTSDDEFSANEVARGNSDADFSPDMQVHVEFEMSCHDEMSSS
jgi:hypothetical protein